MGARGAESVVVTEVDLDRGPARRATNFLPGSQLCGIDRRALDGDLQAGVSAGPPRRTCSAARGGGPGSAIDASLSHIYETGLA